MTSLIYPTRVFQATKSSYLCSDCGKIIGVGEYYVSACYVVRGWIKDCGLCSSEKASKGITGFTTYCESERLYEFEVTLKEGLRNRRCIADSPEKAEAWMRKWCESKGVNEPPVLKKVIRVLRGVDSQNSDFRRLGHLARKRSKKAFEWEKRL